MIRTGMALGTHGNQVISSVAAPARAIEDVMGVQDLAFLLLADLAGVLVPRQNEIANIIVASRGPLLIFDALNRGVHHLLDIKLADLNR